LSSDGRMPVTERKSGMQRISFVRIDRGATDPTPHILNAVLQLGGKPSNCYCNTTSDVEEAMAYHGVLRDGESWCFEFHTYEAAVQVKRRLAELGFYCPPERRTRGGRFLYGFIVTEQNCNKI
jgi:hypothetical protein